MSLKTNGADDTARLDRSGLGRSEPQKSKHGQAKRRKPHPRVVPANGATHRQRPAMAFVYNRLPARGGVGWDNRRRGDTSPRQSMARAYGMAILIGGLVGTMLAVTFAWIVCGYPGMWSRRAEMTAEMAKADYWSQEWDGDCPPISWGYFYDTEKAVTRAAILEDIQAMVEPDREFGMFSWPSLPYMVGTGHESDCQELIKIVDGIYSDYPELSVYTNGQCIQAIAAVARYMLPESSGVRAEENQEERRAVTERLNEIAKVCDDAAGDSDYNYIFAAYRQIATGCTYSDDDNDSPHANDIYGALIEGQTRCYGGSGALKALLDRRGIPSFMASGMLDSDPMKRHAWDMVWFDGKWYVCDVTSAMGTIPENSDSFYRYCMMPYDEYKESVLIDEDDRDLMQAYEERIASLSHRNDPSA